MVRVRVCYFLQLGSLRGARKVGFVSVSLDAAHAQGHDAEREPARAAKEDREPLHYERFAISTSNRDGITIRCCSPVERSSQML